MAATIKKTIELLISPPGGGVAIGGVGGSGAIAHESSPHRKSTATR